MPTRKIGWGPDAVQLRRPVFCSRRLQGKDVSLRQVNRRSYTPIGYVRQALDGVQVSQAVCDTDHTGRSGR
jgi:hypothetical protein